MLFSQSERGKRARPHLVLLALLDCDPVLVALEHPRHLIARSIGPVTLYSRTDHADVEKGSVEDGCGKRNFVDAAAVLRIEMYLRRRAIAILRDEVDASSLR